MWGPSPHGQIKVSCQVSAKLERGFRSGRKQACSASPLLELIHHALKIGIAGAKAPREPVSTSFGNRLSVGDHLKLPFPAVSDHRVKAQPLLDEGRETRDLSFVVLSRRTGNDLNRHHVLQFAESPSYHTVTRWAGGPSRLPLAGGVCARGWPIPRPPVSEISSRGRWPTYPVAHICLGKCGAFRHYNSRVPHLLLPRPIL